MEIISQAMLQIVLRTLLLMSFIERDRAGRNFKQLLEILNYVLIKNVMKQILSERQSVVIMKRFIIPLDKAVEWGNCSLDLSNASFSCLVQAT